MAYTKIILKNDDNSKLLYPRTLSTLLVDEDENTFEPQRLLSTSTGLHMTRAVSGDVISTALTVNGEAPVLDTDTGMWNFNLTDSNTIIDTSIPATPADDHVPSTKLMADNLPIRYQAIATFGPYTSVSQFDTDWNNSVLLNKVRALYAKLQNLGVSNNYVSTRLYLRPGNEPHTPNNCVELFIDSGELEGHGGALEHIPSSVWFRKSDGSMVSAFQWMHDNFSDLFYYEEVDIVLVIDVIPNVIMI